MSVLLHVIYRGHEECVILHDIFQHQAEIYENPRFRAFLARRPDAELWGTFDWETWFCPYMNQGDLLRRFIGGRVPINLYIRFN